ncbi:hypothetical protein NECAME_07989 [Necator americanus]|uniref:Leucine Rich repeat-containing domain protein n=1 Tax=Necator americanus TaxID=51031 RepID=W2TN39_NECAM|nr:hypothetical protein NECAME_07989 [Necator americanus]ETN82412.1 hypothetical protein NECAME_07989 [Necator americanus]
MVKLSGMVMFSNDGCGKIVKEEVEIDVDDDITELDLTRRRLLSVANFGSLPKLEMLVLRWNLMKKIENLNGLHCLTRLSFYDNQIANWSEIAYLNRLPSLRDVAFEMNPIYSAQHFYRNRIREILPRVRIIDGFPAKWITGDPWQQLSEGSEGSCV